MKRNASTAGQTARTVSLPSPVGGLNTRDPLANMSPTDAVVLNNWYPDAAEVRTRNGCSDFATGFTGAVKTLMAYTGVAVKEGYACADNGIFDISAGGAIGAAVSSLTDGYCQYVNFKTSAGSFLVVCNGVDKVKLYDGATWTDIDGVSVPAITGVATTSLNNINVFKGRIWFVEEASMSAWYLPTAAIAGAATEFPVGHLFKLGGYLVSIGTWTVDGGSGVDDLLVFVSSEGELAVYQGTDPSSPSTFALVGVYYIGAPLGARCFTKFGGDLLYISQQGVYPLSKALNSVNIDKTITLSSKIDPTFVASSELYGDNAGWDLTIFPKAGFLIVNVPTTEYTSSEQYVMNIITNAWCRFTGWDAVCFGTFDNRLFFGTVGKVVEAWVGTADYGNNITASGQTAYSYLGQSTQNKHFKLVRPVLVVDQFRVLTMGLSIEVDYRDTIEQTIIQLGNNAISTFDTDSFDLAVWAAGKEVLKDFYTCAADDGYAVSFELQVASKQTNINWVATDFVFEAGGVL